MRQVYEISDVVVSASYKRYEVDGAGVKKMMHEQRRELKGVQSVQDLVDEAKSRVDPGIVVEVGAGVKKS